MAVYVFCNMKFCCVYIKNSDICFECILSIVVKSRVSIHSSMLTESGALKNCRIYSNSPRWLDGKHLTRKLFKFLKILFDFLLLKFQCISRRNTQLSLFKSASNQMKNLTIGNLYNGEIFILDYKEALFVEK